MLLSLLTSQTDAIEEPGREEDSLIIDIGAPAQLIRRDALLVIRVATALWSVLTGFNPNSRQFIRSVC
jgi:hypothetical protein